MPRTVVKQPTVVKALDGKEVSGVACGASHSFAWSDTSQLCYGWGSGQNGRLGNEQPNQNISEPTILKSFEEATQLGIMNVKQVSCGDNHTLALVTMN